MAQTLEGFAWMGHVAEMLWDDMHRRSPQHKLPETHEWDYEQQLQAFQLDSGYLLVC